MVKLANIAIELSKVVIGCWQADNALWNSKDAELIEAYRTAFNHGVTAFDTAAVYGKGHSERLLGQALADVRAKVVIATKVFPNQLSYKQLIQSCENSLKNLQTDYIDLLQIHWPAGSFGSRAVPISETMQALVELQTAGKIRAIGVSNFSVTQLQEAMQHGEIVSVQPPYSLFWRQAERDLLPFCQQHNIAVLAYSSLAQGLLTGKFSRDYQFANNDVRTRNKLFQGKLFEQALAILDKLKALAEAQHLTLTQLAIAWVTHHPRTCAIVGVRSATQAKANAAANNVMLSDAVISAIEDIVEPLTNQLLKSDLMLWES